jgi:hypothetical protein
MAGKAAFYAAREPPTSIQDLACSLGVHKFMGQDGASRFQISTRKTTVSLTE